MRVKINNEELFFNAFPFENYYFIAVQALMCCVERVTCLVNNNSNCFKCNIISNINNIVMTVIVSEHGRTLSW